jgi:hypothetical protein
MTLRQFSGMFSEIEQVITLETGEKKEIPTGLAGNAAHIDMFRRFGKK